MHPRSCRCFLSIIINEGNAKYSELCAGSTCLLGLCYDIRHAMQGDREVGFIENGLDDQTMRYHKIRAPEKNVYFSCNYLYPEMCFAMMAINELIEIYVKENCKVKYKDVLDSKVIWVRHIAVLRLFQSAFSECIKPLLTQPAYTRWLSALNSLHPEVLKISGHFVDYLNIEYLKWNRDKRIKKLNIIARQISKYHEEPEHED